jgi:LPXTG-motif cell wall-anchored protein
VTFRTRSTAVVVGAIIGAFAFLAPAQAGAPAPGGTLTGTSACTTYAWSADWKLKTSGTGGADAVISKVKWTYVAPPLAVGQTWTPTPLPTFFENGTLSGDGVFTATQPLERYLRSAELSFTLTWTIGQGTVVKAFTATVAAPKKCDWPTSPTTTVSPVVPPPTAPAETVPATTSPGASPTPTSTPTPIATPVDAAGTGGGLPVTGAAAGTIAAVAAVLLGAGAILFVLARRRRVKFTA